MSFRESKKKENACGGKRSQSTQLDTEQKKVGMGDVPKVCD